jgi:hypothetical protein
MFNLLHQMVHKCLEGHVVCEDCLSSRGSYTTVRASRVCGRWVELGQQESSLRATCITNDEPRERESISNEILKVVSSSND